MSHLVIAEVSKFLRHTLWLGIADDAVSKQHVMAENNIVLSNPAQPLGGSVMRRLSLWLYHVVPNEQLRNPPFVRENDQAERYPPLVLDLYYLLTPSTGSDEGDQLVLGKALQVFHDQAMLRMESQQNPGEAEQLHVSLAQRTIDELAQVWEAMQQPYRLSVCYVVRVVRVTSQRLLSGGRVLSRSGQLQSAEEGS